MVNDHIQLIRVSKVQKLAVKRNRCRKESASLKRFVLGDFRKKLSVSNMTEPHSIL